MALIGRMFRLVLRVRPLMMGAALLAMEPMRVSASGYAPKGSSSNTPSFNAPSSNDPSFNRDSIPPHGLPNRDTLQNSLGYWMDLLRNSPVLPSPVMGRSPETGFLVGMGLFFGPGHNNEKNKGRGSQWSIAGAYTAKKQWILSHSGTYATPNDRSLWQWNLGWRRFWDRFYGTGPGIDPLEWTPYRFHTANFQMTYNRRLGSGRHFVGPVLRFNTMDQVRWDVPRPDNQVSKVPGYWGHRTLGLGMRWIYDTRPHVINARRGVFFEGSIRWHAALGRTLTPEAEAWKQRMLIPNDSIFNPSYLFWNLDLRGYQPLRTRSSLDAVWAWRLVMQSAGSGVSFREMPALGGDNLLRGHFRGAYRDLCLWGVENEWRGQWGGHFGWNLYNGWGMVGPSWSAMSRNQPRWSYGAGLRWTPNPKARTLLRIDWARTIDGQSGLYFEVNEAF